MSALPTIAANDVRGLVTARIPRELALLFALGSLAYVWLATLRLSLAGLAAALALIGLKSRFH